MHRSAPIPGAAMWESQNASCCEPFNECMEKTRQVALREKVALFLTKWSQGNQAIIGNIGVMESWNHGLPFDLSTQYSIIPVPQWISVFGYLPLLDSPPDPGYT